MALFKHREIYNIYCDESCHLPNDGIKVMVLGAIWCPAANTKEIFNRIVEIKQRNGFAPNAEVKWNKVSNSRKGIGCYLDLVDYFFDNDDLHYRCVVIPDKTKLDHDRFGQDHSAFYYKMYFTLLKVIFSPNNGYNIYLDIKDTQSQSKVLDLENILRTNSYDYSRSIVRKVQQVHSHEIQLLQLGDIITGAMGYCQRGLKSSDAKLRIIEKLRQRSGYSLTKSTLLSEDKLNLFIWEAQ